MIKSKMSDAQVVQQVLNIWNPFNWGQFDEYTSYVLPIIDLLKTNSPEHEITKYLEHIRFDIMESSSLDKDLALPEIAFYSWSLKKVWETHLKPHTNIRLLIDAPKDSYQTRIITPLEKIQYALINHDCFQEIKFWLYGSDNLFIYDQWAKDLFDLLPSCIDSQSKRHDSDFQKQIIARINKYINSMWKGDDKYIAEKIYHKYYLTHDAKVF